MAQYNPPNELLTIFNPENYFWEDLTPLTVGVADLRYLKKTGDTATGTINFSNGIGLNDGTVGTPALSFISNTNTGIYRSGTNQISIASGGVEVFRSTATANQSLTRLLLQDGTATAPAIAFSLQTNTGIYRAGTNQINFSINGALRATISNVLSATGSIVSGINGTVSAPAFSFLNSTNTGLYRDSATGALNFAVNGVLKYTVGTTVNTSYNNLDMNNNQLTNAPQVGNSAGNLEVRMNNTGAGGTLSFTGGTGLLSGTAGGSSGQHLAIIINGVSYKIALLNP
jgi:hypothetical protein